MRKCEKRLVQAVLLDRNGTIAGLGKNWCMSDICNRPNEESGKRYDLCNSVHAEETAIYQALMMGHGDLMGYTLKVNYKPCRHCESLMRYHGINWEVE